MAKVSAIMNVNVPTLNKEASISDAAKIIIDNAIGCVVIVEGKAPIGIITESDILNNIVLKKVGLKEKVEKIMSVPLTVISPGTSLEKANKVIDTKHFRRYPVVMNGNLIGLVTENSVVQAINSNVQFHRNIQNAVLIAFVIFEFCVFILYKYIAEFATFLR